MRNANTTSVRALTAALGDWHSSGPAYLALAHAMAALVTHAKVPVGSRVPAERELAAGLQLSRTTVSSAYDELRRHGYLVSKRGAGSWTALPPGALGQLAARLDGMGGSADHGDEPVESIDLTLAAPRVAGSIAAVQAAIAGAVSDLPRYLDGHGYDSFGLLELREAIARRYDARGLATTADQILVTSGAQQAIDLVLHAFVRPAERVIVESPTYPRALDAIAAHAARPVPIDIDRTAWDAAVLDTFAATLRQAAPALSYLIADFHNPTGALMTDECRAAAVGAVQRAGSYLMVDETLADLAPAPMPVAVHDQAGRVVSIGSLGKTVWGGFRLGWVRADPRLVQRLAAVRSRVDMAGPVLEQLIGVRLLASYDDIVRERRSELVERRDALVAAVREKLPQWSFVVPAGGLSLWVELDRSVSSALAAAAAREGVRLAPGSRFGTDSRFERRLRLPFTLPVPMLIEAVERLARAVDLVRDGGRVELVDLIV